MLRYPQRLRPRGAKRHYLLRAQRIPLRRHVARAGTEEPPPRPVFIVGCPQSGPSLVYSLLRRHEVFRSPEGEGRLLWNAYRHPRFQYASSHDVALGDVRALPAGAVVELAFEDLFRRPVEESTRVLERIGLEPTEPVLEMARNLDRYPAVTTSAPDAEKWRESEHEIARVWPHIESNMESLGYEVTIRP